ncbi:vWA domain-containing protein [Adhaeretor mobilis]|uniref:von Willebrand factor type A domain protein n=1 Tax=Adhaeretor mobilis TaxID=1930276 RepID=A0A517MYU3_9BACT|nr:VWA domain-containing protein [Adhaeretor mobilis]QDT00014.1 von Willebrand factor type A domain protein [Adhaeretor mobilis]
MPRRHSDISPHAPTVKIPRSDLPRSSKAALAEASDEADEAVLETFVVEVSAGKKATTQAAPTNGAASSLSIKRPRDVATTTAASQEQKAAQSLPTEDKREPSSPNPRSENATDLILRMDDRFSSRNRKKEKKRPHYLSLNFILHMAALVCLSMFTLELPPKVESLELSSAPSFFDDELEIDLELDAESLDELTEGLEAEFQEVSLTEETVLASDLLSDTSFAELSETSQTSSGEVAGLFGSGMGLEGLGTDGIDQSGLASEVALEPLATFFGEKIEGRRIVFLVDNSGGMNGGGLETLIDELLRTVNLLTPRQGFYVIFYSDIAYPMFFPRPARDFIRPTTENKKQLAAWLDTVELCTGNAVDQGLAAARATRPDTVFLLTDGRVNTTKDGRKLAALLDTRGRQFVIHTFGMGTSSTSQASQQLQEIAAANGGRFKRVEITGTMKALALQKARPYHSKQPGSVWGRQVGSGW